MRRGGSGPPWAAAAGRRGPGGAAAARLAGLVASLWIAGCAALVTNFDFGGNEARSFSLAVAGGDTQRAYQLVCPAMRFGIPYESFRAAVEANPFLIAATDVTIQKYESGGGVAVVQRGWLESSNGVTAATFHLSRGDEGWCLTGVEIGGTPALPAPGPLHASVTGPSQDRSRVAATLRSEAYRAYGLSNPSARRYRLTSADGSASIGTQRAQLLEAEARAARFRIVRGGGLAAIGSLEVSLEADGIHLVASSQGTVTQRTLILPAKLAPGTTWETDYRIGPEEGGTRFHGTDVVLGRERIATAAGEFDAVRVESDATLESGTTRATVHTTVWYADDVGSVRTESDTTADGTLSRVVVELVDRGDAA